MRKARRCVVVWLAVACVALVGGCASQDEGDSGTSKGPLQDGTYVGQAMHGFEGTVTVKVTGNRIVEAELTELIKGQKYEPAIRAILQQVVETQDYTVDAYSGATKHTREVITVIEEALAQPAAEG